MSKSNKSKLDNTPVDITNFTRSMLTLNPVMGTQAKYFWKAQDQILKEAESFMSAWFQRRHNATSTAMDAASHLGDEELRDPATIMQLMTDWQTQSMERLTDDAKDYSDMMTRCIDSLVDNEKKAAEETIKPTKRTSRQQESTPA